MKKNQKGNWFLEFCPVLLCFSFQGSFWVGFWERGYCLIWYTTPTPKCCTSFLFCNQLCISLISGCDDATQQFCAYEPDSMLLLWNHLLEYYFICSCVMLYICPSLICISIYLRAALECCQKLRKEVAELARTKCNSNMHILFSLNIRIISYMSNKYACSLFIYFSYLAVCVSNHIVLHISPNHESSSPRPSIPIFLEKIMPKLLSILILRLV